MRSVSLGRCGKGALRLLGGRGDEGEEGASSNYFVIAWIV